MNHASFWGGAAAPYEIEQSLRFDGSSYLQRTPASAGSRTTFTWSGWVKYADHEHDLQFFSAGSAFANYDLFRFSNNVGTYKNKLEFYSNVNAAYQRSNAQYRDPGAWYHVVGVLDTNNATAGDRLRIYVNGERIDSWQGTISLTSGRTMNYFNTANQHRIGLRAHSTSSYPAQWAISYYSEVHFIDGTAVDPEGNFGEFDDNGVWRPIAYTGSYGTNGFYLKFDPSATNGIGHDHSGNGNNFTPSGFTTSGAYTDVMDDTPTNNFATLNPLTGFRPGGATGRTYSDGNLVEYTPNQSGKEHPLITTTQFVRSADGGVYQWEDTVTNSNAWITFNPWMETENAYGSGNAAFFAFYNYSGYGTVSVGTGYGATGTVQEQGVTLSANDVVTTVVDFDNNTIAFYVNGTRNGYITGCNFSNWDIWSPGFAIATGGATATTHTTNFGQQEFQYTPVSGAKPWSTAELDAPEIANPSDHFNVVLYTGNGGTQSITGVGFNPDLVWCKSRNSNYHGALVDKVRGATKYLYSSLAIAEETQTTALSTFDSDGFSLNGSFSNVNNNNTTYVAWCWKAGGSGSNNTDGSITSTVSANPSAGFSIVTYTGTGANATVGHGLGVAPEMVIIKRRNLAANWAVYHASQGPSKVGLLDYDGPFGTQGNLYWNSTAPSNTVVSIGTSNVVNNLTSTYVAYCWHSVPGYSRIGAYAGNGNDDGPFVYTGFRTRFLLYKNTASTSEWYIIDTARNIYNPCQTMLYTNLSNPEYTYPAGTDKIDVTANGFKIRYANTGMNASGVTYIYMAFAEHPTGGSGVSPATAR